MERTAEAGPEATRRRRMRLLLGVVLVLLAVVAALWIERRPIASHYIDRTLAARGVPARYHLADLGLGRQRLTGVVIGNPAAPDLTADWIETEIGYGLHGPYLAGARAGQVRLEGRLADGRVSLGAIDKLLPAPSGKPFALPQLAVDVSDLRMRLATPAGLVALAVSGAGRLDDGFAGRLAATAPRLTMGDCAADVMRFAGRIATRRERPTLTGPLGVSRARCGPAAMTALRADLDVTLGEALDRWRGSVRLASAAGRVPRLSWQAGEGALAFAGTAADTRGRVRLAIAGAQADQGSAGRVGLIGRFRAGQVNGFDGQVRMERTALAPALLAPIAHVEGTAAGTPVGPLADELAGSLVRGGRRFDAAADLAATPDRVTVRRARVHAASGAVIGFTGDGAGWSRDAGLRLAGTLTTNGGGLPAASATFTQAAPGAPIRGRAAVGRFAAGPADLVLAPVRFVAAPGGAVRVVTDARLSGPLGDGRVEGLTLPLDLRWSSGRLLVNPGCFHAGFDRLTISGLRLQPAQVGLCPIGAALVTAADGRIDGGARLGATTLAGQLGSTPLTLATQGVRLSLAGRNGTIAGLEARLGSPGRLTRLTVEHLDGRFEPAGLAGHFAGAGGQIGNVPLLLSGAAGDWRLASGALTLGGMLTVADADTAAPRFQPLAGRDVRLTLKDGTIDARGILAEPASGTKVAEVTLDHRLRDGRGEAVLAVPGLTFTQEFQPDRLTRLTFGVVADVRGTVAGDAHIAWDQAGVASTGTFATKNMDLAAAFGPVTGLATTLHFTDLLNLATAPGQVATIASVNPGVAVTGGVVTYQLLPGARVQVEGARWPFAGGTLTLDPTLLDFSAPRERRLTFHVDGVAADRFLQQFDFKNLDATGTFDGVLPMIFDEAGGRIENGRLTAREGGGGIAYVGDLTQKDLGFWGNLAFQSLKSLRYRNLDVRMNGPLAGEMITDVRFAGVSQGTGAKSNFLIRRLQKLPFVFNIRIKAPFRGLIDSAQSFYDPRRLIQRNLPALLREQNRRATPGAAPIQPPASETVP